MLRRHFMKVCGFGSLGLTALNAKNLSLKSGGDVVPRGTAENIIYVALNGAPSHVDTFDLKLGSWTPANFEPATMGNLLLPTGLFPNLSQHTGKFSLLRCISGNEAVHARAQYLMETSHTFNPTFSKEQPHIGSVAALELAASRKADDYLPSFMAINALVQGPGMLDSSNAAFTLNAADGVLGLNHPGGETLFGKRYESLLATDGANRTQTARNGQPVSDYHNFYHSGSQMMYKPELEAAFAVSEEDLARYGDSDVGRGCAVATNLLRLGRGARFIQVTQGGWDHHYDIYGDGEANNIYSLTSRLDPAISTMLSDLSATPGKRGGSLLDETLVVVMGEFGRTPGNLTGNAYRDHYPYAYAGLFAGGGIVTNQAFGATDPEGWAITDRFWTENRDITMGDVVATMYSSLGIDWTKEIQDTPSGRVFEYTPKELGIPGYYKDIAAMFS